MPTSTVNAPSARRYHTAVWTGSLMVVWGGVTTYYPTSGGRYVLGAAVDDDGDGYSECDGDCNDGDVGAFAVPVEVTGLAMTPDKVTLSWDSAAPGAGSGTVHDVSRGLLVELPVGSGAGETCLAPGIADSTVADPATPGPGSGYWYLVRGRNSCGAGTYGIRTGGMERSIGVCP